MCVQARDLSCGRFIRNPEIFHQLKVAKRGNSATTHLPVQFDRELLWECIWRLSCQSWKTHIGMQFVSLAVYVFCILRYHGVLLGLHAIEYDSVRWHTIISNSSMYDMFVICYVRWLAWISCRCCTVLTCCTMWRCKRRDRSCWCLEQLWQQMILPRPPR